MLKTFFPHIYYAVFLNYYLFQVPKSLEIIHLQSFFKTQTHTIPPPPVFTYGSLAYKTEDLGALKLDKGRPQWT